MKTTHYLLSALITFLPLNVIAEEVFKSIDESGATVFSDEKTQGSKKIEVNPNVVDVDIPDMPEHTTPVTTRHKNVRHTQQSQPIEIGSGTYPAGNLRRNIRNRTNGEGIHRPVNRPAVRAGGHR